MHENLMKLDHNLSSLTTEKPLLVKSIARKMLRRGARVLLQRIILTGCSWGARAKVIAKGVNSRSHATCRAKSYMGL